MPDSFSICTRCKSLTTAKDSGLCVKCECFDEINSGKLFRTKSERVGWPVVPGNNFEMGEGVSGGSGGIGGIQKSVVTQRSGVPVACGSGTPLPFGTAERDLEQEAELPDQLRLGSSSLSNTKQ